MVAGGNNYNFVVPTNGILQEIRVRVGKPSPFYLDSSTTVFVASKDTGVKKSAWLQRRTTVLQEGVSLKEIVPVHIPDKYMHADAFTKYLPFEKWKRHMDYVLNHARALIFGK